MIYLSLIIVLSTAIGLLLMKKWKSPLFVYNLLWALILYLYSLRLFGLYEVSEYTKLVILLGTLFFNFGYLLMLFNNKMYVEETVESYTNTFFIKCLAIYTFLFSLPFNLQRIQFMRRNNITPYVIKFYRIEQMVDDENGLMQIFERPFEVILIGISAYYLITNRKQTFIIMAGIYFSIIRYITLGSRFAIFIYVVAVVSMIINNDSVRATIGKYRKVIIVGLFVIVIAFFSFVSSYNEIYRYLVGCIPMLDKVVNLNDGTYDYGHTYGFYVTIAIWRPIWAILRTLGFPKNLMSLTLAQNAFSYNQDIQNIYQSIAPGIQYNAFVTYFSAFFIDFSYFGVVVLSFLYGVLLGHVERMQKLAGNLYYSLLLFICYYYVFTSMVRLQFTDTTFGLAFIYIMLLKGQLGGKKVHRDVRISIGKFR